MPNIGLKEFISSYADVFALILGLTIFFNFTDASNPAVRSFLWLLSSLIILALFFFVSINAFYFDYNSSRNTSTAVKFLIGLPMSLIGFVLSLQFIISLFEPGNQYSLNVLSQLFSTEGLKDIGLAVVFIILLVLALLWIRKVVDR